MIRKFTYTAFVITLLFASCLHAQPLGFVDETVADDFDVPTALAFDKTGQLFLTEKPGRLFIVNKKNGDRKLLLDLTEEVYDYLDHGLNGFALDPDFDKNGYIYLLYTVDRNYLYYKDSTNYDLSKSDLFAATIGRITRYTYKDNTIELASRKVILGEDHRNAIPILMDNHGLGSLVFGTDGSLLVTVGDVAIARDPPFQEGDAYWWELAVLPVQEGIITEDQNIGPYRSQYLGSLNGKILRINPETGEGYPSNPYYQEGKPSSPQSRIWASGLRNAFRFCVKPETGSQNTADGDPGTLFVGDVGWLNREELNIVDSAGMNFGWPYFEGVSFRNKLFDADLTYLPEHPTPPIIEWRGDFAQAMIDSEAYGVGSPEFKGEAFSGNASIGGIWLTTNHFPDYNGTYIQGDYEGWVKIFKFDFRGDPYEVVSIVDNVHPLCFAEDPTDGSIYYTNYFYPSINELRHLYNEENPNAPPVVQASIEPLYGYSPLNVKLDAAASYDPEGEPVSVSWRYNNNQENQPGTVQSTTYTSNKQAVFFPSVTVTDAYGKSSVKKFRVFVNNFPPEIVSTSVEPFFNFHNEKGLDLALNAEIKNHDPSEELYYEWSVVLHHEEHSHLITSYKTLQASTYLAPIPCDEQDYSYEVKLEVHDASGISSTYSKMIFPLCEDEYPLGLELSPNPVDNYINIKGEDLFDKTEVTYQVFDAHGRMYAHDSGLWGKMKQQLNKEIEKYSSGVYILKMVIQGRTQSFKFVKN